MEDYASNDNLSQSPIYWLRWLFLVSMIVYFIFSFRGRKQKKPDLKTRLWRRFIMANGEILQHLNDDEKSEMLTVYNTTVQNAELFQKSKSAIILNGSRVKERNRSKKVTFQLE